MLTPEQEKEIEQRKQEVDVTLMRWMLSLTYSERLKVASRGAERLWTELSPDEQEKFSLNDPDFCISLERNDRIMRQIRAEVESEQCPL
jgi:hypothetical protein